MRELGLKELIKRARDDLMELDSQARSGERKPALHVKEVVVELNVIIEESTEGKGGFDLKVVTAGTSVSRDDTQVQKVTVRLAPLEAASLSEETFEGTVFEDRTALDTEEETFEERAYENLPGIVAEEETYEGRSYEELPGIVGENDADAGEGEGDDR